jgi:hypothetical protein
MPDYHLREKEYQEYQQGCGRASEEEQRRKREQEQKRLDIERVNERAG